jgi:hypothetical protein
MFAIVKGTSLGWPRSASCMMFHNIKQTTMDSNLFGRQMRKKYRHVVGEPYIPG